MWSTGDGARGASVRWSAYVQTGTEYSTVQYSTGTGNLATYRTGQARRSTVVTGRGFKAHI
jgi:hypothetical protein